MKRTGILTLLTALLLFTGCGVHKREPLEKQTYLLDIQKPADTPEIGRCITVLPCRVASPYGGRSLVYRTGAVRYEQDYYHLFMTGPNVQITEALQRWFQRAESTGETAAVTLRPEVDVLCADFQDAANPVAVVEMHVTLKYGDTVKKRSFKAQTPLPAKPAAAQVVEALSRSLTDILTDLEMYLIKNET